MKNKALIKYLQGFDPETDVHVIVTNITERKKYHSEVAVLTDGAAPAIFANIIGTVSFDEEERRAAEEAEREIESETE